MWICAVWLAGGVVGMGAEVERTEAERAWAELEGAPGRFQPPGSWRSTPPGEEEVDGFRESLRESAREVAEQAKGFLERYPEHESAGEARFLVVYALANAVAAGDAESEAEAERFVEGELSDPKLSAEEKAKVLLMSANVTLMKRLGMRFFVEGQQKFHKEMDEAMVEALLKGKERFPGSEFLYTSLLAVAERSEGARQKELVGEILGSRDAPKEVRFFAEHLAKGTKPYEIGKPVEIRFTGLNEEVVDLAAMKGKVVLIDFWSTTCGPCIAQMPELKELMEKHGEEGFQIVGVNLDEKESRVRAFLKEQGIDWPQHFSGKGWANPLAVRFGIFAIPTNWLIDKKGNLRSVEARGDLEGMVARMLAEE